MTGFNSNASIRLFYVSTAIVTAAIAQPAYAEVRRFDIPAQPAKTAIAVFAKQSGRQILASENVVRAKRANAVTGKIEVAIALNRLLAGTGLGVTPPTDASGIFIVKPVATFQRTAAPAQPRQLYANAPVEAEAAGVVNASSAEPDAGAEGDILVTARRRSETSLATPVVLTGVSRQEIERRHLTRVDELNNVVPQLQIGQGSIQGGSVVLRGIGANASTTTADQGVTFNIDGAQVARSSIRRIGQMDLEQIEVLKGPQGLFFGKNSPGGVISMRTADPTRELQAKASALYEFVGREAQFDGFVSGPVTDTLGVRVAILASHMSGWEKNILSSAVPFASPRDRLPHDREINGRLTLKFAPSDAFDTRFKINYGKLKTGGYSETRQYTYCPFGTPQLPLGNGGSGETCKADDRIAFVAFGTNFSSFGITETDPVLDQSQLLSSLEMNYRPTETLTFTSLTSLYKTKIDYVDPYFASSDPGLVIVGDYHPRIRELSQELRLASNFDGPVNFLLGVYLQDSKFSYEFQDVGFPTAPLLFDYAKLTLDGSHVSVFGQARANPIPTLELSAGGRYSWEKKQISIEQAVGIPIPTDPKSSWKNFSPELTAAWRPTNKLTVFGSYKRGFLSGGYTPFGEPYDQQITKGFEAGVKASLLNNRLRVNISAYRYVSTGLQITTVDGIRFGIDNAGKGTVKGIEADLNWQTGIEGLTLRAAVGYNQARYNVYTGNCYPGQTIAAGCNEGLMPSGVYTVQNLRGRPFNNAPNWSGNSGVNYEQAVGADWHIGMSADASYTSSYYTESNLAPKSKVAGFWMIDANLRLMSEDRGWELALLGRNLTNEHPYQISNSVLFTGGPSGTAGPTFEADRYGFINRGRQLAIQVTKRFGGH